MALAEGILVPRTPLPLPTESSQWAQQRKAGCPGPSKATLDNAGGLSWHSFLGAPGELAQPSPRASPSSVST